MAEGQAPLRASRGPFVGGYTSAVPPFMAGAEQLVGNQDGTDTNSSRDCIIDPVSGSVSKRGGCAIVGDTVDSNNIEQTGILNASWGARARKGFALDSPSMSDSYPVPAVLYSEDTNAGFPTADSGFPGTLYVRSSNSSDYNYSLLEEFSMGDTYGVPASEATPADYYIRMVPVWVDSGDGVYTRGALTGTNSDDKFLQQFLTSGSRSCLQTQSWVYFPNLRATPWRWNKRLNEVAASASQVFRGYPTGPFAPLWSPTAATPSSSASATAWSDGDTYYLSVIFQFEDGSYSLPFIPRAANSIHTAGVGMVTVGTIGNTSKYRYMTYSNVPIGPEGTVARIILRTPKQTRTASTDNVTVAPLDLRIVGVLRNNTQTTYVDYGGDDDSLVEDDDVVRFDLVCPRRARYIGTGDQRVVLGYTLPNTAAIMLAPVGATTSYDRNETDSGNAHYGSTASLIRITSTDLELHYNPGAANPTYDTAPVYSGTPSGNAVKFPFATYTTLEDMVDAINKTTVSSNCEQWAAQLAPGVDGTMPSSSLTLTTFDVTATTSVSSTTVTSSAAFGSVGVGMEVKSGTANDITSGTYVVSKASSSSITLSNAAGAGAGAGHTLTFYQETGDNGIVTGGTLGYIRAFGPSLPVLLHMKASAFPNYDKPDKQAVYYTMASPGAVQSGSSMAPNSFLSGNKLVGHSSPRQEMSRTVMGIVDVEGAAVVAYSDGIYLFKNVRGGNTGEDFDCRLFTINDGRGCISHLSLVSGNGWAAYATTEGIVATDKTGKEVVISGDVFNASDLTGDLAYEIAKSAAAAASDDDTQTFSCGIIGSKLYVGVMGDSVGPRLLTYDFSKGIEANGLEELLDPEKRSTYIWSPPHVHNGTNLSGYSIGPIFCVRNASGRVDYMCYNECNLDLGRLEQINIITGSGKYVDNGDAILPYATLAPVVASEFMALQPNRFEATHKTISTAATMYLANNQTPTFQTASGYSRGLYADAERTRYNKQVVPIAQAQRGKTDMLWIQWRSSESGTGNNKLWRVVLEYNELENDNAMQDLQ